MKNNGNNLVLGLLMAFVIVAGCEGGTGGERNPLGMDGGDSTGTDEPEFCDLGDRTSVCGGLAADGVLRLTDPYNYKFSSTLNLFSNVIKGQTDFMIDWSGLTTDLLGRTIDPVRDINLVLVSIWPLSREELASKINNDTLQMGDNKGAIWIYTDGINTSANLLSLGMNGDPNTPDDEIMLYFNSDEPNYNPDTWTHLIMAQSGTIPGNNARMVAAFTVNNAGTNTHMAITPQSSDLTYSADLRSQQWIPVASGDPNITLDWESMEKNTLGNEFAPTRISRIVVAHYMNDTPCDLENDFLRLEEKADEWYEKKLTEVTTSTTLADLVLTDPMVEQEWDTDTNPDPNAIHFSGIDATGTWIVGLFCGKCANPAPWFLSVLHPCS